MKNLSPAARFYICGVMAAGLAALAIACGAWESSGVLRFGGFLAVTLLASGLKVTLPGITGTLSVSYVFILLGLVELHSSETVILSCAALLVQTYWHARKRPTFLQASFNVGSIAVATGAACWLYHWNPWGGPAELALVLSACVYFVVNTLSVAGVVSLTEHKNVVRLWRDSYFWSFPYYLLGASLAAVISRINRYVGWQLSLLLLPALYIIYRSYSLYLGRLEDERKHAEEERKHAQAMAALHLRTIEALALAIEAKDATTHAHLERVQVYAVAIGRELGLPPVELEALRAAAILHDIGKLAVPEHIISKPGKLTPEEFEKMKIHPVVGADILERVQFPYPVAPVVRAHHERWDGTGYPDGLAGEQIPLGARILAAVDCLDALASDRQYRPALPLDEAMAVVLKGSGTQFDPRVVEILHRRYRDLEEAAKAGQATHAPTSATLKIIRGDAPAAGFEQSAASSRQPDFLHSIAAAREEMQMLYELTTDLGNSLSLPQTLSVLDARLKPLLRYDAFSVWVLRDGHLTAAYFQGEDAAVFSPLRVPLGEGLSGWVAGNVKPMINGDPAVTLGASGESNLKTRLRSGLSVPLEGLNGVLGTLTVYSTRRDAFTRDHLRILLAISSKASLAIDNALRHRSVEISATTDSLTGLPNARSLFLHLDSELSRCRRVETALAVLVCDLDGFKQVNDRFGHLEGNKVLKLVAQGLQDSCDEFDCVARMGGDEFVLILPGARRDSVDRKILAVNAMVRRVGREVCGEDLLSVSVGESFYPQHGSDAEQLLAEADRRMYKMKHEHRELSATRQHLAELRALSDAVQ